MHMRSTILALAGLVLISMAMVAAGVPRAVAQDATPQGPADSFEIAPGVTADSFLFAEGQEAPTNYRLHFAPGVTYEIAPSEALELAYVESGTLALVLEHDLLLGEVGASGQLIAAGTTVTVAAGQYFVLQPGVTGEVRNEGTEPATVSVAGIMPGMSSATPEASPAP
jgi:hypothetical protein